ncbi:MAG: asparagine synthase (glutamine-hydrolyzing) [Candidatus Methanoperedens sp.]|nr:asparagine synthase (glutamine-hydrolyzing) [Candidatus Methanoperedens sp.]
MCGINGRINLYGKQIFDDEITLMNDALVHRGPDDSGIWIENNVGLGHRRLSIIDLSYSGHQPMKYNDKVIVHNGEIFNFLELKTELESKGYEFKSKTDTEVILASYNEWGIECLDKLRGMFAFVIYDKSRNILFGARDRFGKKPLKYFFDGSVFIFASELKAILTQKEVKKEVDWEAIDDYLTLQYVPHPKTGFQNIFKLPQAHYFTLDLNTKKFEIKRYWVLDYSQKLDLSEKEWVKLLEEALKESVRLRMISDVPLGAFLSGGIDSGAVVAFMSQFTKVKTFSIGFEEKDFDETYYARMVANRYNTDHHELIVKSTDMTKYIEQLIYQYEEPYADSSQLPTFILSKFAREYVTVILNGDGGDENFGGYDKYMFHLFAKYIKKLPFRNVLMYLLKISGQEKAALFIKILDQENWEQHVNYTNYFDTYTKNKFYTEQFIEKIKNHSTFDFFEYVMKNSKSLEYMDRIFYLDFNSYVPDDLMVKVDIATMANSLESRSPLLDHKFVELVAQIPSNFKVGFNKRKYIFKKMLEKHLDKNILNRKKKGFAIPLDYLFRNELKEYVKNVILDDDGLVLNIMKKEMVQTLLQEQYNGKNNGKKLWALMVLNLWYNQFFKNGENIEKGEWLL